MRLLATIALVALCICTFVEAECCTNPNAHLVCIDGVSASECCGEPAQAECMASFYHDVCPSDECERSCCCTYDSLTGIISPSISYKATCAGDFVSGIMDIASCTGSCSSFDGSMDLYDEPTVNNQSITYNDQCIYFYNGTYLSRIEGTVQSYFPNISKIDAAGFYNGEFYFFDPAGNAFIYNTDVQMIGTTTAQSMLGVPNVDSFLTLGNSIFYSINGSLYGTQQGGTAASMDISQFLYADGFGGSAPSKIDAIGSFKGTLLLADNEHDRMLYKADGVWGEFSFRDVDAMFEYNDLLFLFSDCTNDVAGFIQQPTFLGLTATQVPNGYQFTLTFNDDNLHIVDKHLIVDGQPATVLFGDAYPPNHDGWNTILPQADWAAIHSTYRTTKALWTGNLSHDFRVRTYRPILGTDGRISFLEEIYGGQYTRVLQNSENQVIS